MVGSVGGTGGPVHEERSVGGVGLVLAQPGDGVVGQILGEVVTLAVRRFDRIEILIQPWFPLRGLTGDEPVEVVEAVAGGPTVERPHRGGVGGGGVVPLAEGRRAIAIVAQHLGDGGGVLADHPGVAVPVHRAFGDRAGVHAVMVSAGQQRGPGGGADRGGVKGVVADSALGYSSESRGPHLAAHHVGQAEPDVVEQHDEDVRRLVREVPGLNAALMG